jgi:hypothetical protein
VPNLLMLASGVGLVAATAALCVQGGRRADHRLFAGLISIAVTLSLFSFVTWAATAIAPLPFTWFLLPRPLFPSRYDCIESYRNRLRANLLLRCPNGVDTSRG